VVAHRLTQAQACDRIAVMANGRIVELGTPDELVAAGGAYAELWSAWHR
jgi:ATP-binding cassette subfamily C protein